MNTRCFGNLEKLSHELDIIFNSTQDAMFLMKVAGNEFRYLRNNVAHQRLTGYSNENLAGKTPVQLLGPDVGRIMENHYRQCVQAKAPMTYEETMTFPAGTKDWLVSLSPMVEQGEVRYIVVSRKDITRRKKAEAENNKLLAKLQAMFDGHQAAMVLVEPGSGKIIDANPAALELFGYSRAELLQLSTQDIHLRPAEEVKKLRLKALKEKQKYSLCPYRLKNGEVRLTDVYTCPIVHNGKKLLFSIVFDVMDREQYKKELYLEKEILKTTLLSIGDGMVTTDRQGRITAMNIVAEKLCGWNQEQVKGRIFNQVFNLVNEETGIEAEDPVATVLETGKVISLANHTLLVNSQGDEIPIADSAAPIKDPQGKIHGVVIVFRDVSQEREYQNRIIRLSQRDFLTGLYNRRFIRQQIGLLKGSRYNLPLSVIMADINGLRLVNDIFGHQQGDGVLKQAANILKDNCRKEDIVARWGGDEFLILLPRTDVKSAERIRSRIEQVASDSDAPIANISIALGLAVKKKEAQTFDQVLAAAEEDLYRHKLLMSKSYRNTIVNTMLATLYAKSQETEEHAMRLKEHSTLLGRRLGLSAQELDELELLALLHDIGKIGVDANILNKPDVLSLTEWKEVKKHPEIGYRIASNIPELCTVAEYILHHHERWDGKGYPQGLKGEEIPLLCRILALADAFDAMTSDRPYRKAISREQALTEIKRNAGSQFDPRLAEEFQKMFTYKACSKGDKGVI
ncbi:MAG TPA: PAS domain S-box protein [bacterium]|nr:PAS domain S-box protein [bacterium]